MKTLFLLVISFSALQTHAREWKTPDFFIDRATESQSLTAEQPKDCRQNIAKVMCLVDPAPDNEVAKPRPCLPGGEAYAHFFEELYDNYPPTLQRMFCSLKIIHIEKQFFGTAYGGLLEDEKGNPVGAVMGVRKSVLDEGLNLATWASWKEQLSFGGVTDSYRITPGLPQIETASKPGVSDFLYFLVAHEFGHIFDFANGLNKCLSDGKFAPETWGTLSWISEKQPLPENEFLNRSGLCFYWCNGKPLAPAAAAPLYETLYHSTNFISIYSTTQAWDDFADSLAYFLIARHLDTSYAIGVGQGQAAASYDIRAKLLSAEFAKKREYIEAFLRRDDIRYP